MQPIDVAITLLANIACLSTKRAGRMVGLSGRKRLYSAEGLISYSSIDLTPLRFPVALWRRTGARLQVENNFDKYQIRICLPEFPKLTTYYRIVFLRSDVTLCGGLLPEGRT
jgi:hypothetical protein